MTAAEEATEARRRDLADVDGHHRGLRAHRQAAEHPRDDEHRERRPHAPGRTRDCDQQPAEEPRHRRYRDGDPPREGGRQLAAAQRTNQGAERDDGRHQRAELLVASQQILTDARLSRRREAKRGPEVERAEADHQRSRDRAAVPATAAAATGAAAADDGTRLVVIGVVQVASAGAADANGARDAGGEQGILHCCGRPPLPAAKDRAATTTAAAASPRPTHPRSTGIYGT